MRQRIGIERRRLRDVFVVGTHDMDKPQSTGGAPQGNQGPKKGLHYRAWAGGRAAAAIAVGFLDHLAEMSADPKLDSALRRQASVALDEAVLRLALDGA